MYFFRLVFYHVYNSEVYLIQQNCNHIQMWYMQNKELQKAPEFKTKKCYINTKLYIPSLFNKVNMLVYVHAEV